MSEKKLLELLLDDCQSKRQKVVILGMDVWCSPLTLAENAKVQAMHPGDSAMRNAAFVVMKCTDAEGKPLFTSDDKDVIANRISGTAFDDVFAVLNGRTVEQQKEK